MRNLYLKRFLRSNSAENLIGLFQRCRQTDKEITESWAMLEAAKRFIPGLDESLVIVVGDGVMPRTGALFAYFTKAGVISVDPLMDKDAWEAHLKRQALLGCPVQRLGIIRSRVEDYRWCVPNYPPVVAVWPHSHADLDALSLKCCSSRTDIVMPCCKPIPRKWAEKPHIVFDDYNVLSPRRTIHIWSPDDAAVAQV